MLKTCVISGVSVDKIVRLIKRSLMDTGVSALRATFWNLTILPVNHLVSALQSNFNGSNIFGTVEICSRYG